MKLAAYLMAGVLAVLTSFQAGATEAVATYDAAEVAWSKPYGPNVVDGVARLAEGAGIKTCAGEDVTLRPRSAFEDHRTKAIYGNLGWARISAEKFLSAMNPEAPGMAVPPKAYDADARIARCSIDGKFLFTGLPDGEYYATVMIIGREALGKPVSIDDIEVVMRRVNVAGGGIVKLDLFSSE